MYREISEYIAQDIYPFHMPGHKGNTAFFPHFAGGINPLSFDLTEIPEMDVLASPKGIIKDFQERIANFYGAEESFFLVNGASAGIVAAVCAVSAFVKIIKSGDASIFVPRNAHVSLYNGLILSGANPTYFLPETTPDGLFGGVSPCLFDDLPKGAAVFIVSPTYEGFVSDIASIAEKVHARGGILIVDEAHGAHFPFHEFFPKSALSQGADIVINSLHKTLPAISGCAVLHVRSGANVDISRLRFYINAMQTSSPSYLLMASCDFMLKKLWETPALFNEYVQRLIELRKDLSQSGTLQIIGRERVGENAIYDIDMGKLLFKIHQYNEKFTAQKISEKFVKEHKIQVEMAREQHILAMTSVADTPEGFARLRRAVKI